MYSNASFAIRCRVQKCSLNIKMLLFSHESTLVRVSLGFWYSLNLIHQYSILIDHWAQDEVICLLLDKLITICCNLIVTN